MTQHAMTEKILHWFTKISEVPRKSKHEEKIRQWMKEWAEENKLEFKEDQIGNVLMKVPASAGYENCPVVTLQGHLDMVCEKTPDSDHDFSKDPIKLVYDGEWLTADRTTLGADNGIAMAMAMTLVSEKSEHPPLELLFTVDEETGLTGAKELKEGFLEGKILLNIDSEDEGYFTVGCAGGRDTELFLPLEYQDAPEDYFACKVIVGCLKGGHSGIDISGERGNALRLLVRALRAIIQQTDLQVVDISGGSAHNAIPRDAVACVVVKDLEKARRIAAETQEIFRKEFINTDAALEISIEKCENNNKVLTAASTSQIIDFLLAIPHGVAAMSTDIDGLVETSNNMATVSVVDQKLKVLTSQRSSIMSRLDELTARIEATARIAGGEGHSEEGYPAWQPNMASPLLKRCTDLYKKMYDKEPVVEVIHAGLECGLIGNRYPEMDMISFGPTIQNPHCPDERIHIESIGKVWDFMVALLKSFKEN